MDAQDKCGLDDMSDRISETPALLTDRYQLTMLDAYYRATEIDQAQR